ncbi:hypothetical protein THAOC_37573 [Thalassiosira oceanica]|uniref:Uncharacterized protein n=1 Tax=Thalassiosira oceanica TaxID=159749 RepID=K0RBN0_THAOC|nr:hypothetical protein THAOC_37573 [Thalassiosira oceanica]|eukprot:EJK43932.1 hypothetical protein THAOC_37573 [Thalassiosira oceanica]
MSSSSCLVRRHLDLDVSQDRRLQGHACRVMTADSARLLTVGGVSGPCHVVVRVRLVWSRSGAPIGAFVASSVSLGVAGVQRALRIRFETLPSSASTSQHEPHGDEIKVGSLKVKNAGGLHLFPVRSPHVPTMVPILPLDRAETLVDRVVRHKILLCT